MRKSFWFLVYSIGFIFLLSCVKSFASTGYTTTGMTSVLPRTWTFKDDGAIIPIHDSEKKEVAIETLDDKNLRITLTWDAATFEDGFNPLPGSMNLILPDRTPD
jgi:hypothetical protein